MITVPADATLWSAHDEAFGHYRRDTRERLERVWCDLPVTPLLVSHAMARLYPVVRGVRSWNRLRGRAAGHAGTDFTMPPGPVNTMLEGLLAGEADRLVETLSHPARAYRRGVSLVAILRREPGRIEPAGRPADVPADVAAWPHRDGAPVPPSRELPSCPQMPK